MLKADRNLKTCWKGFLKITLLLRQNYYFWDKNITFETKIFFENVGKISTAMGRTILKYIYPWSVLHTFTIRWISTLDMTLVRSYHMGKFTSSYLQFSKNLASQGLLCSTWRYKRTLLCDRATWDTCPGSQKIWPLYL